MSQKYPDELDWLLGDDSDHELFLFENGREGLAKIDCTRRNTDVKFKIKAPTVTEVYVYPGILDGDISLSTQGSIVESNDELFNVIFKNQFSKLFEISKDSTIEYVYLYFRWNEGYNIDMLIEKCFVCEIKNEEWPISFSIERTKDQRDFNHKRNSIYTHKLQKYIHAKQLITLQMLKYLRDLGGRLFHNDYSVTYVGSDDSSNFETALTYLLELRGSVQFKQLSIRANSRYDDLQLKSIEKLYRDFTGHRFVEDDVVQNHEEDWNSNCDLIIDTFTIQAWGQKSDLLCSSVLIFMKELRKRITALNDNGALILVTPEPLSAFGRIYPDSKEGTIEDKSEPEIWFRELHEQKIGYFLQKLLNKIDGGLDDCSLKVKVYDFPGIGGGVLVRKEKADEFNQKQETDLEIVPSAEGGWKDEGWDASILDKYSGFGNDESVTPYNDFIRKSVELLNWRESRNEQS